MLLRRSLMVGCGGRRAGDNDGQRVKRTKLSTDFWTALTTSFALSTLKGMRTRPLHSTSSRAEQKTRMPTDDAIVKADTEALLAFRVTGGGLGPKFVHCRGLVHFAERCMEMLSHLIPQRWPQSDSYRSPNTAPFRFRMRKICATHWPPSHHCCRALKLKIVRIVVVR